MAATGRSGEAASGLEEWYRGEAERSKRLLPKIKALLEDLLGAEKIEYADVTVRTKTWESYRTKATGVADPRRDIRDLCGVRIVTYFETEQERAASLVKREFCVDIKHSPDKRLQQGPDRLGYRGVHFVVTLDHPRVTMAEWRAFADMRFEIQVMTVLNYAWAQFEHDRGYKSAVGKLPPQLERRLRLAAGLLEVADREFDQIAAEVERYRESLAGKTEHELEAIRLDAVSVRELLVKKLPKSVANGALESDWPNADVAALALGELDRFGLTTLGDLDDTIPPDYDDRVASRRYPENTLLGVCRDVMVIKNAEGYFGEVWRNAWTVRDPADVALIRSYGVDVLEWVTLDPYRDEEDERPPYADEPDEDYEPDFDDEGD